MFSLCASPCLAVVNYQDPVLWAVMIGWVLSVVLHELAHGVVAHLGGDHTIRDRGGLTLNPLQYVDPVNSLLLPALFMFMGGVPLPGGATYVRRDLLRGPSWATAMSLAGPAVNFAIFGLIVLVLHPHLGFVHPPQDGSNWTNGQQFLATLATLEFLTGMFNLLPLPPLDGFNAISTILPADLQAKLRTPQAAAIGMGIVFLLLWKVPHVFQPVYRTEFRLLAGAGLPQELREGMRTAYNDVMFGG
jgi:Zn-dependent protease